MGVPPAVGSAGQQVTRKGTRCSSAPPSGSVRNRRAARPCPPAAREPDSTSCRNSIPRLSSRRRCRQAGGFGQEARVIECFRRLVRRFVIAELNAEFEILANGFRPNHAFRHNVVVAGLSSLPRLLFLVHYKLDRL